MTSILIGKNPMRSVRARPASWSGGTKRLERNEGAICANCTYWELSSDDDWGFCHFHPPPARGDFAVSRGMVLCLTDRKHWCGQHPDLFKKKKPKRRLA